MNQFWIEHPTSLSGQLVDLLPLEEKHFDQLHEAASNKRIWEFYVGDWSVREKLDVIYKGALAARERGNEYPFVIFYRPSQKIIGSTRLMDMVPYDKRLEIGGTWLMPEFWNTAVNFDCKLTLLTFCFEKLLANRIQLKTQHDNIRSRKAIEKIGGVYEGIMREHMLKDNGTFRSSAYFSILKSEWENVKPKLQSQLAAKLQTSH